MTDENKLYDVKLFEAIIDLQKELSNDEIMSLLIEINDLDDEEKMNIYNKVTK